MKKKIYISIPISGLPEKAQREKADLTAAMLSKQGYRPINPLTDIYAGEIPDYYDTLCLGLRSLADCDAVYFCSGWEDSLECCIEHDFVMRHIAMERKEYKVIYEF